MKMIFIQNGGINNDKTWEQTLRQADNRSILSNKSKNFETHSPNLKKRKASISEALERKIDAISVRSKKSLKSIMSNRSRLSAGSALKNLSPDTQARLEGRDHKVRIGCSTTHSHGNYKPPKIKKEPKRMVDTGVNPEQSQVSD